MPIRAALSASKRDRDCRWRGSRFLGGWPRAQLESQTDAGRPGDYKWALTGMDPGSGLGSAHLIVDANAQSVREEPEQKYCIGLDS